MHVFISQNAEAWNNLSHIYIKKGQKFVFYRPRTFQFVAYKQSPIRRGFNRIRQPGNFAANCLY